MTFELGTVKHYGRRAILKDRWILFAEVPLPLGTAPIEERRAKRDADAQRIVDALNQLETEK